MKSKAMVLKEFNKPLQMTEFEIPILEEGQVLIKVEAAGICGSDIHMWKGEDPRTPLPMILGHEGIGKVADIAGRKTYLNGGEIKLGDLVLWNRGVSCHKCYYCNILKDPSLCENRKVYGINISSSNPPYLNGCYSEYIILSQTTDIFKITEDIDPAILVSASCSGATAAHAFDMVKINSGDNIVIQGPGPLGMFAVAFSKDLGASNIIVIGGSKERLKLCKTFGANHVLDRHNLTKEERKEFIMEATGGRGADIVIEAVGVKGAAEEGIKLLRMGGTYLSTGFAQPAGMEQIDFFKDIVRKNIKVQGVWVSDASHTYKAMKLVLKNKVAFSAMITHRFKLENANEAIKVMNSKEALKAVLISS